MFLRTRLLLLLSTAACNTATAVTILQTLPERGAIDNATPLYLAQGFVVPLPVPVSNFRFAFLNKAGVASATGTLYLFSADQITSGQTKVSAINESSPVLVAKSVGTSAGEYLFEPDLLLQPLTSYFAVTATPAAAGSVTAASFLLDPTTNLALDFSKVPLPRPFETWKAYYALTSTDPCCPGLPPDVYVQLPLFLNFRVTGTATPEPGTATLFLIGAGAFAAFYRGVRV